MWRVQVAHLHSAARALSSPSRCFQSSTNPVSSPEPPFLLVRWSNGRTFACSYDEVITKFSRLDRLSSSVRHGASAHRSYSTKIIEHIRVCQCSAPKETKHILCCIEIDIRILDKSLFLFNIFDLFICRRLGYLINQAFDLIKKHLCYKIGTHWGSEDI